MKSSVNRITAEFDSPAFNRKPGILTRHCLLGLAVLILAACQTSEPLPPMSTDNGPPPVYTLGPGDQVRIIVYNNEALSGTFVVDSTGRVALPLIRGVSAEGLTLPSLEEAIGQRLVVEQYINPKVSVDLIRTRPVCILGEVNKPGCFEYIYGMRAATAIALAGGYTYRALQNQVLVMRVNGHRTSAAHDTLIYPGDVIEVAERLF